ncbi:AAA family ATPase [Candidatus Woesearchaeota archaeon]|nr:AAA family ATPase [Candidatus Woesearchaeota archaeon]
MFIIGLCGPSGSGKTTIAKALAKKIDACVVGMDNYFHLDPKVSKYNHLGKDLELPENTDWDAMNTLVDDIHKEKPVKVRKISWKKLSVSEKTIKPKKYVIIEGFLLLHNKKLREKIDLNVYIDISDEVGLQRRLKREGQKNDKWFREVTFPEYSPRRKIFEKRADLIIDGEEDREKNVQKILELINKHPHHS